MHRYAAKPELYLGLLYYSPLLAILARTSFKLALACC
jgi:hypothetical protein